MQHIRKDLRPVPRRDRERSTQRILQAGLEVFAEEGYDAATTKRIARRAGLNESLVHRYYKSKNGLLLAVLDWAFQALRSQAPYTAAPTPEEEIYRFLDRHLEHAAVNEKFLRVVISRSLVNQEFRDMTRAVVPDTYDPVLAQRLRSFQRRGLISRLVRIPVLVRMIMAFSFQIGFMERQLFARSPAASRRMYRAFSVELCRGICPARGQPQ